MQDAPTTTSTTAASRRGRADAQRNRQHLLQTAIAVLTQDPCASLREIADASGLGRTTLYRHFASREEVLDALLVEARTEVIGHFAAVASSFTHTGDALRALGPLLLQAAARYPFLEIHEQIRRYDERDGSARPDPLLELIARGREAGELRTDIPTPWMLMSMRALAYGALTEVQRGHESHASAGRLLGETFAAAFGTTAAARRPADPPPAATRRR